MSLGAAVVVGSNDFSLKSKVATTGADVARFLGGAARFAVDGIKSAAQQASAGAGNNPAAANNQNTGSLA